MVQTAHLARMGIDLEHHVHLPPVIGHQYLLPDESGKVFVGLILLHEGEVRFHNGQSNLIKSELFLEDPFIERDTPPAFVNGTRERPTLWFLNIILLKEGTQAGSERCIAEPEFRDSATNRLVRGHEVAHAAQIPVDLAMHHPKVCEELEVRDHGQFIKAGPQRLSINTVFQGREKIPHAGNVIGEQAFFFRENPKQPSDVPTQRAENAVNKYIKQFFVNPGKREFFKSGNTKG